MFGWSNNDEELRAEELREAYRRRLWEILGSANEERDHEREFLAHPVRPVAQVNLDRVLNRLRNV